MGRPKKVWSRGNAIDEQDRQNTLAIKACNRRDILGSKISALRARLTDMEDEYALARRDAEGHWSNADNATKVCQDCGAYLYGKDGESLHTSPDGERVGIYCAFNGTDEMTGMRCNSCQDKALGDPERRATCFRPGWLAEPRLLAAEGT